MSTAGNDVRQLFLRTLTRVVKASDECDSIVWEKTAGPTAPSVAFHAWHVARWMDFFRDAFEGPGTQMWDADGLSAKWGLAGDSLGYEATGMGMGDDVPPKFGAISRVDLLAYLARSIEGVSATVRALSEEALDGTYAGHRESEWAAQYGQVPRVTQLLLAQTEHSSRHLGMMEAMIGVHGMRGSATQ